MGGFPEFSLNRPGSVSEILVSFSYRPTGAGFTNREDQMPKFIVELRDNKFNTNDSDPVVGYLGEVHRTLRDEDGGERAHIGCVSNASGAIQYDTEGQANYDLNRLSDEFFDRFSVKVAPA
jgi:hypothetical protein